MEPRGPEDAFENVRLERERRTIDAMVETFCRDHHRPTDGPVCAECADFEAYARLRLEKCPYGETKPTCVNCPIHCYQPQRREQVRRIMAYSGPRMLLSHPILAIRHILDGHRKAPPLSSLRGRTAPASAPPAEAPRRR